MGKVVAQGDHACGGEGGRINRKRRPGLPQGPEFIPPAYADDLAWGITSARLRSSNRSKNPINDNGVGPGPGLRHVIGRLHAHQCIGLHSKSFLKPDGHVC